MLVFTTPRCSVTKMRPSGAKLSALGWEPTIPVEQNVREYVAWMREQDGTAEYLEEAERVMREQGVVQSVSRG